MDEYQLPLGHKDVHLATHLFNPERLTLAREMRGLTKAELAERVGRSPSAITQFESGQIKPDARTLGRMALSLGISVSFFGMTSNATMLSGDACNFRSLRSATQRERRRVLAMGTLVRDFAVVLERLMELPKEHVSIFSKVRSSQIDVDELAAEVRREWGLGLGPIPNLIGLLESKGILVAFIPETSHDVDAFSAWHDGRPMVFLLSKGSPSRTRFDAAHELGHLVMHSDVNPGSPELERQANRFAGAFLLPKETFLRECPNRLNWDQFFELKRRWRVSVQALLRRAYELGCLSDASYRRGYVYLNQTGQRVSEKDEPPVEQPYIIPKSIEMLKADHPIEELAAQIGLNRADLQSILSLEASI